MPANRAPGPDGFNGLFLKRCWPIIQNDFYNVAKDFYEKLNLQNISGSLITLVPKKPSPENANKVRPFSLTNVCLRFLANAFIKTSMDLLSLGQSRIA
jgi:hypothetical protein